jgi:hypothetical protein
MSHPLVLALYPDASTAASAARALHGIGVSRDQISVVSRNHDEEGVLAEQLDASPGADIEDSRPAARLGELSGHVLAAIALVTPGIGPIVAAGPLAAGLGEAAGHVAGGVASTLQGAGLDGRRAEALEQAVQNGALLLGVHATADTAEAVRRAMMPGATEVLAATWASE